MKKVLPIQGMHCASCELVIADAVREYRPDLLPEVSLARKTLTIEIESEGEVEQVEDRLRSILADVGYKIGNGARSSSDLVGSFLLAVIVLGLFAVLQRTGVFGGISLNEINYLTAFVVGVIASFSTCLVVVGGFVLALSAEASTIGVKTRSIALFHFSRLASFTVFGGLLGLISKSIQLSATGATVMQIVVAIVLLLLGLNLLSVTTKMIRFPIKIKQAFDGSRLAVGTFAPIAVGAITFFLPCGFTQSMQVYTLTTGSFVAGALTMLAFALGTLPVLLVLSYGGYRLVQSKRKEFYYQTIGFVVIGFALFTLISALRLFLL